MKNKRGRLERHRKPVLGIQPKYTYSLIGAMLLIFGLIIRHILFLIGLIFIFAGLLVLWFTIIRDLLPKNRGSNPLEDAIKNIHEFYRNQGLVIDDANDLNYYLSPVTIIERGLSLRSYCIPAKRSEMLSEQTLDSLQAFLDNHDCRLMVKRSYYDHGYIIFELGHDLDNDRLDF